MHLPIFINRILIDHFRITAIGVVAAILAVGYFALVQSRVTTLQTSGYLERAKVERELTVEKDYLQRLRASNDSFHKVLTPEKLEAIDKFIPTGTDFSRLLLTIRNIASAANLDLASINVSETAILAEAPLPSATTTGTSNEGTAQAATVSGVTLRTQDISVSVDRGQNYETFKRFMALIESSQRLLDVISVNFTHSGDTGASSTYTVILRSYYLPES